MRLPEGGALWGLAWQPSPRWQWPRSQPALTTRPTAPTTQAFTNRTWTLSPPTESSQAPSVRMGGSAPQSPSSDGSWRYGWCGCSTGEDPAPTDSTRFADVDAQSWWAPHVERLADLGITQGCSTEPLRYCPDSPVSRAQMASFLARAYDLETDVPDAGFADVGEGGHSPNISAIAAVGITTGWPHRPPPLLPLPVRHQRPDGQLPQPGPLPARLHRSRLRRRAFLRVAQQRHHRLLGQEQLRPGPTTRRSIRGCHRQPRVLLRDAGRRHRRLLGPRRLGTDQRAAWAIPGNQLRRGPFLRPSRRQDHRLLGPQPATGSE